MTSRQEKLIKIIVEEYINSAEPVASGFLVKKFDEDVSSATIRNDMVALEKDGMIEQPHTSAGRIPTEKAYRHYLDNFYKEKSLSTSYKDKLDLINKSNNEIRNKLKEMAKYLAEISGQAVVVAFADNDIYYTGISNLFSQPEFFQRELVMDMSRVIDHLDSVVSNLFNEVFETQVELGAGCPFGARCASIITKVNLDDKEYLISLIGPMRMDYQKNISLINYLKNL